MEKKVGETEHFEQGDISLRDLWRVLVNQKNWVTGVPILCVLLAAVGVSMAKPKWEATAVIQIGQVGQSGVGQGSQLIEPPIRAIERMKKKSFEEAVPSLRYSEALCH